MKLSTAIRLGSMLRPQTFDVAFDGFRTCAFGAAFEAVGDVAAYYSGFFATIDAQGWTGTLKAVNAAPCPSCGDVAADRCGVNGIPHLNDHHRWSREAIADWVETIEAQQAQAEKDELARRVDAGGVPC